MPESPVYTAGQTRRHYVYRLLENMDCLGSNVKTTELSEELSETEKEMDMLLFRMSSVRSALSFCSLQPRNRVSRYVRVDYRLFSGDH